MENTEIAKGPIMPLALNFPEILEKICEHLPFDDLKTSRLVNWTWNKAARRSLRSRCKMMKFALDKAEPCYDFDSSFCCWKETRKFLKCLQQTKQRSDFPVPKLFLLMHHYSELNVAEFLTVVSPFVEELWIKFNLRIRRLDEPDYSFIKLIDYAVLKKVKIILFDGFYSWEEEKYPLNIQLEDNSGQIHFFTNLFRSASQLQTFCLEIDLGREDNYLKPFVKCHNTILNSLELSNRWDMIQHLETDMPYDNAVRLARMKLTSLKLCVKYKFEDRNTLRNLLKSQSETLRNLEITEDSHLEPVSVPYDGEFQDDGNGDEIFIEPDEPVPVGDYFLEFPQMKKLESFTLKCPSRRDPYTNSAILEFRNISYHKQLPALKKLEFVEAASAISAFIEFATDSSETVTDLNVKQQNKKNFKNNSINFRFVRAHIVFPKLKKLTLSAKKYLCDYVYTNLNQLEELTFIVEYPYYYPDEFNCVTGLPMEFQGCGWDDYDPCKCDSDSDSECSRDSNRKSLSCLTHLIKLKLVTYIDLLSRLTFNEIMKCKEMQLVIIEHESRSGEEMECVFRFALRKMRSKFAVCSRKAEKNKF